MTVSSTFDSASIARDLERIELHVGRITLYSARIDQKMTRLLGIALGANDPTVSDRVFNGELANTKMKFLRKALPDSWAGKRCILDAIEKIAMHRNALSHSALGTDLTSGGAGVSYELRREKKNMQAEPIEIDDLDAWEHRALVVSLVVHALGTMSLERILNSDPRRIALEFFKEADEAVKEAIDFLFDPGTSGSVL